MAGVRRLVLAVAFFCISSVACLGTAVIENQCDVEVYVWSIANVPNDTINYLEPIIGSYNETYRVNPNGGGISLKIATVPEDSFITQFEYTYHPDNPILSYDISNINGYPFENWGLYLSPSSGYCSNITCDPGVALCPEVYNHPNDDFAVKPCDVSANLTLTLCPQFLSSETVTATVMTTDYASSVTLPTPTTIITSIGPASSPQCTLSETDTTTSDSSSTTVTTTISDPVAVTVMTTDDAGDTTLTTLTTAITSVGSVVISQGTLSQTVTTTSGSASTTVTMTNSEPVIETVNTISSETILRASETTDAAGQLSLTTLTTVVAATTLD